MIHPQRIRKKFRQKTSQKRHKLLDLLVYSGALFGPLVTIPQIYLIWVAKDSTGVSLFSWSGYLIGSFVLFVYGFVYADLPIALTNAVWVILNGLVVFGLIFIR